ncbi:uncharacterized protein LOC119294375 [Triticum dicoccoides]|uniref:uncharacterized protein LOC119294375 n=1 Tax=Triticum dicoccoides TaxID=85692 RepID=UPI00188F5D1D|nr:uncharacterized protein LOC119294375 [Triticum dicoccoides]
MPLFQGWKDLPLELLRRVADGLDDLRFYTSVRGTCMTWRRDLAPPAPSLLVLLHDGATRRQHAAAVSLPAHRSFGLKAIPSGSSCLGCGGGWLVLSTCLYDGQSLLTFFHPVTATEILLPPLIYDTRLLSKIVFTPDPARDDFAAATICDIDRLAYVTAGARRWAVLDRVRLATRDQLIDVVYHQNGQNGMVYCLTRFGNVYVLCLPERRRRKPVIIEDQTSAEDLGTCNMRIIRMHNVGPDLNASASVQPLLSSSVGSIAPPYVTASAFTSAKNLVFCNGNLYRSWRNASCTVTLQLPGGGHRRIEEDEIFVLRYDPRRRPCWDAVADLGGYTVFVGRSNAVSMHAEGVPGLKGNCVYWIGGRGRDQGMVFDMGTGRSTPCLPPAAGVVPGPQQCMICWYFPREVANNCNTNELGVYGTRARVRAQRAQDMSQ